MSRPTRRHIALAAITVTALACAPLASAAGGASAAGPATPRPTIVLEHGAFADASGWNAVSGRLQKAGYTVVAPANPLRGLPEDSAQLTSVLNGITGPVVLVGHSYGGAVITEAAAGNPNVKALVYIAALMPDAGENLGTLAARSTESELTAALRPLTYHDADGDEGTELSIDPARFRAVFAADLPAGQAAVMAAGQRPVNASAFADTATAAAWRTIPTWALVARQDKTLGADLERYEARRAGATTVEINSSHIAPASHPDAVTNLIVTAARATNRS
jgi:pimeloyl-ACP methyl ester carboxylesterase